MEKLGITNKAYVIGARETVRGFHLIGVPGKEASSSTEVLETLDEALNQDYSVIILSASCIFEIEDQIAEIRKNVQTPIIIISDVNTKVDEKQIKKQFRSFVGI
ncbi:MAG: V-type ATP synthase subunit F [Candidatus Heimdallarchaeota archaeon]|nr:V-type ATP synthase subunit F [Candidatus Heimdallarchaeota archaeon]